MALEQTLFRSVEHNISDAFKYFQSCDNAKKSQTKTQKNLNETPERLKPSRNEMVWIMDQGVILIVVAGRVKYFHFSSIDRESS